jgi:hypothetical protein
MGVIACGGLDYLGAVLGLGPPRRSLDVVSSRLGTASASVGILPNASRPRCGLRLADPVSPHGLTGWCFHRSL